MKKNFELECYIADLEITSENIGNGIFQLTTPLKIVPLENKFTFDQIENLYDIIHKSKGKIRIMIGLSERQIHE